MEAYLQKLKGTKAQISKPPQLPNNQDDLLQTRSDQKLFMSNMSTKPTGKGKKKSVEDKPNLGNLSRIKSSKTSWSTYEEMEVLRPLQD